MEPTLIYECSVAFVSGVKRWSHAMDQHFDCTEESSLNMQYVAENLPDAIQAAVRWAYDRKKNFFTPPKHTLAAVKVWTKVIGPILDTGEALTRHQLPSFEWKYDYPVSLEEAAEEANAAHGGTEKGAP